MRCSRAAAPSDQRFHTGRQPPACFGQNNGRSRSGDNALADWLSSHPEASLADVAFTLQVGRRRFPHRRFVVCRSVEEGVAALRQPLAKPVVSRIDEACERTIAFMFPGGVRNTSGWHAAYTNGNLSSAIASIAVRLCSRTSSVATSARFSSRRPRTHTSRRNELAQTRWTQPCLFAIEMALAKLLASWGIKPTACVGHSVGEFAAACVAGVFSLEDGLTLVADRARLMQSVPPGRMLAVVMGRANSHRCWATGFRWRR